MFGLAYLRALYFRWLHGVTEEEPQPEVPTTGGGGPGRFFRLGRRQRVTVTVVLETTEATGTSVWLEPVRFVATAAIDCAPVSVAVVSVYRPLSPTQRVAHARVELALIQASSRVRFVDLLQDRLQEDEDLLLTGVL